MTAQYLMTFAIGPVQEFIAIARRSRDLWFGSWVLSELSKAAAKAIIDKQRNNLDCLIFPAITNPSYLEPDSKFNVVNKIVALVELSEADRLADFGKDIKDAVVGRMEKIRNDAWGKLSDDRAFLKNIAEQQVNDLLEFFWAAVPLNDSEHYAQARSLAESLLAARKNTRDFEIVKWGSKQPKSSLDGLRESVIPEEKYPNRDRDTEAQQREKIRRLRLDYGLRAGERLCGVGLLKRLGNRDGEDSFLSTSHVAALPLLKKLENKKAVDDFIRELTGLLVVIEKSGLWKILGRVPERHRHEVFDRYDGHLLFEERLREFFTGEDLSKARNALSRFLDCALKNEKPNPYYALLLADGDRMGEIIDAQPDKGRHRALSLKLSEFAKDVRNIVENEHQGSLVYSGGDDVLAFLPLHTALGCARDLASHFKDKLKEFKGASGDPPTLSAGIAISHHLDPLSDALELARAAENAAKSVKGKDALCVKVDKRSGETTTVKGKWEKMDERLEYFTLLHVAEAVPDGAAYELRDLAGRLEDLHGARQPEAIRILKRKRGARGQTELDGGVMKRLEELLKEVDLAELADELIVARLLATAKEQSGWTAEQAKEKLNPEVKQ